MGSVLGGYVLARRGIAHAGNANIQIFLSQIPGTPHVNGCRVEVDMPEGPVPPVVEGDEWKKG